MERKYFDDRFISEDSLLEQKEDKHSCLCSKTLSKRPHLHPEIEIFQFLMKNQNIGHLKMLKTIQGILIMKWFRRE